MAAVTLHQIAKAILLDDIDILGQYGGHNSELKTELAIVGDGEVVKANITPLFVPDIM
jgi:hypothetical protein